MPTVRHVGGRLTQPGHNGDRSPDGGRAGGPDPAHGFSYAKALLLAVVAIALGAYLLQLGGGHTPVSATDVPGATSPTTTTTAPPTSTPTTTGTQPSQAVKVLVANASDTNGVAGDYTHTLAADGWGTLTATNATTTFSTSSVYYAAGQQGAADAIATTLGIPATAVQALSSTTPVQGTTGASVVVVIGDDLAAKATSSTAG